MSQTVSKSAFKPKALEYFRRIEETGEEMVITDNRFAPITNRVALRAVELPGSFHPESADRLIVATALVHGAAVVSKDKKIRAYRHVRSIW